MQTETTQTTEVERAHDQVEALVARWRGQHDKATVERKARGLAAAICSDMLAGADEEVCRAMLRALDEAGL